MNATPPPVNPSAAEVAAAQEVLDAAAHETTPVTPTVESPTEAEKDATIAKLQAQLAEAGQTPAVETEAQKIARLEGQVNQLLGSVGSAVAPLTQALSISSPQIKWASVEPGLKYAIKMGLIKAEDLGAHVVKLFEENL